MRFFVSVQNVTSDGVYKVSIPVPFACRIVAVSVVDANGIAADNTDYIDGDITGTTGYDSRRYGHRRQWGAGGQLRQGWSRQGSQDGCDLAGRSSQLTPARAAC